MFLSFVKILARIFFAVFVLQLVYMVALKWVAPPITLTQIVSWVEGNGIKKDYVEMKDISINAKLAAIASEDKGFLVHHGFEVSKMKMALQNYIHGWPQSGSSTISQQVAKNVFLWQGGRWWRKWMESYLTVMIESIWGKKRILEIYLNVIEMGKGIFGIEAASHYYFHKSAKDLTRQEAILIICALPSPRNFNINSVSPSIVRRSVRVGHNMDELSAQSRVQQFLGIPM